MDDIQTEQMVQTAQAEHTEHAEQTCVEPRKRDPNATKRKYELKNITREQRIAICRKAATKRALAARRVSQDGIPIQKDRLCFSVVRVTDETKREIERLAVKMNLSYGEVVQIAMENLKEAISDESPMPH